MKTLIVDDDSTNRVLLQHILRKYGPAHVAVNGTEAVEAVRAALKTHQPYDLVCLDILMPEKDGQQGLKEMRALEQASGVVPPNGAKIVMTTALADSAAIEEAIKGHCSHYLTKPIDKAQLLELLRAMALIA
jgi:two-component system chemotaxis response regulator CheY